MEKEAWVSGGKPSLYKLNVANVNGRFWHLNGCQFDSFKAAQAIANAICQFEKERRK